MGYRYGDPKNRSNPSARSTFLEYVPSARVTIHSVSRNFDLRTKNNLASSHSASGTRHRGRPHTWTYVLNLNDYRERVWRSPEELSGSCLRYEVSEFTRRVQKKKKDAVEGARLVAKQSGPGQSPVDEFL
ncbi:uncharacterized protein LOC107265417 [Cephus cinctus]|uniref:Uncharacterized protein LOC107265417 n=1 Tax=Cephus cinctus TaxID=211228 RepID=A0AAJ7VYV0_CEPCN|nr:uncharacterized protein LOC107265417 [Cephus cinctus]XP_024938298.1 uncharacterized protein LOC107265417 [Cephus cinctus]